MLGHVDVWACGAAGKRLPKVSFHVAMSLWSQQAIWQMAMICFASVSCLLRARFRATSISIESILSLWIHAPPGGYVGSLLHLWVTQVS
jgi:hypothetical protein